MNISSVSSESAAQEARETAAQTRAEAFKGDQQAVRKLAKQQTAEAPEIATPSVDQSNSRILNVKV